MNAIQQTLAMVTSWFSRLGPVVTMAAALTTVIGAGTAGYQLYSGWHDAAIRRDAVAAAIRLADGQLQGQDYALSWEANAKALALAPNDAAALSQQARIAMQWLDNIRLSSKPGATTFSDIVDP